MNDVYLNYIMKDAINHNRISIKGTTYIKSCTHFQKINPLTYYLSQKLTWELEYLTGPPSLVWRITKPRNYQSYWSHTKHNHLIKFQHVDLCACRYNVCNNQLIYMVLMMPTLWSDNQVIMLWRSRYQSQSP